MKSRQTPTKHENIAEYKLDLRVNASGTGDHEVDTSPSPSFVRDSASWSHICFSPSSFSFAYSSTAYAWPTLEYLGCIPL